MSLSAAFSRVVSFSHLPSPPHPKNGGNPTNDLPEQCTPSVELHSLLSSHPLLTTTPSLSVPRARTDNCARAFFYELPRAVPLFCRFFMAPIKCVLSSPNRIASRARRDVFSTILFRRQVEISDDDNDDGGTSDSVRIILRRYSVKFVRTRL